MSEQLKTDLENLIEEEGVSHEVEEAIRIFQDAFASLSQDSSITLDQVVKRTSSKLIPLVPQERIAEIAATKPNDLYTHFLEFWGGILLIASRVPHQDNQGHTLLVKTVQSLKETSYAWKGLPGLRLGIREAWNKSPISLNFHPDEDDQLKLNQWLNLNSFVARLFGAGVIDSYGFPISEIRSGLEDDLVKARGACSQAEAVDNIVGVASEWLTHAGPAILKQCLVDKSEELDPDARRSFAAGVYFLGYPGFNLERWGFWKRRLRELRPVVGEGVAMSVARAIETMVAAEKALVGN